MSGSALTLQALTLYWKSEGEDHNLGTGYYPIVPPVGALLSFPCEQGVTWRVVQHYCHLVMEGSQTWRAWRDGRSYDGITVDVFVESAEGPFEP